MAWAASSAVPDCALAWTCFDMIKRDLFPINEYQLYYGSFCLLRIGALPLRFRTGAADHVEALDVGVSRLSVTSDLNPVPYRCHGHTVVRV